MLRAGRIDRARFTDHANAYLTPAALADLHDSLAPLGEPSGFMQASAGLRGNLLAERFILDVGTRKLQLSVLTEPKAGGRIEEAMVSPIN